MSARLRPPTAVTLVPAAMAGARGRGRALPHCGPLGLHTRLGAREQVYPNLALKPRFQDTDDKSARRIVHGFSVLPRAGRGVAGSGGVEMSKDVKGAACTWLVVPLHPPFSAAFHRSLSKRQQVGIPPSRASLRAVLRKSLLVLWTRPTPPWFLTAACFYQNMAAFWLNAELKKSPFS